LTETPPLKNPAAVLKLTPLSGIPEIRPDEDLAAVTWQALQRAGLPLLDGDVLVLAQKIVSKSEGRYVDLDTVQPSPRARALAAESDKDPRIVELMLRESRNVLRVRPGAIIVEHRLGFVCANAGIDRSNLSASRSAEGSWVLLLPLNPDASASTLRAELERRAGVCLGVLIIDSHGRAWRYGTVGTAIGLAGLPGLVDLRGVRDRSGTPLQTTEVGAADELAAAASLLMGQAAEGTPIVHVRGFPYPLREAGLAELLRPRETDLFR
jgi:coenzyme F420-0:L-glutamate ligase/coenzyme F420-1:gamma-L-glutamate ligase